MLGYIIIATALTLASASVDTEWAIFKHKHNKHYGSTEEETIRRYVFHTNYEFIETHNQKFASGESSYYMRVNRFADMTTDEVKSMMNGLKPKTQLKFRAASPPAIDVSALPDTVDWRDAGIVTAVKDQGNCGSCWAFSATGSMEGQHALATGDLVSLSEQDLVDCSDKEGDYGCDGGLMDSAFQYVIDNNGIDTEDSYPYLGVDSTCQFSTSGIGATISSYKDLTPYSESALQDAVANIGPVSVAIDASQASFSYYAGGVYDEPNCSQYILDHGVLAVGYGTDNGQDYWLVKNSWGTDWGIDGYIEMSRNKDNQCGIASLPSYPIV